MNKNRRKQIAKAIQKIEEARTLIEIVRDEEQEAFENMPDGIQSSGRGEKMGETISSLDEAIDDIDNLTDRLNTSAE